MREVDSVPGPDWWIAWKSYVPRGRSWRAHGKFGY